MKNSIPKAAEHALAMVRNRSRIIARRNVPDATAFGSWSV